MSRLVFTGLVVLAAVCLAFGAVGIGVGVVLLAGVGVLIYLDRRRQGTEFAQLPEGRAGR
jgi:hypothetical protein